MGGFTLNEGLALWGAALSTCLAAIKIHETLATRRQLVVNSYLSLDDGGDHKLHLTNVSGSPILLQTWAVVPTRKVLFWRTVEPGYLYISGRSGAAEILPPKGQLLITVTPNWPFQWQTPEALKRPPYLRVYFADRQRPLLVRIVSPEQRRGALRQLKRRSATEAAKLP